MSRSRSAEVAVIGGGVVGSSVAYELACTGARVVLVDASHQGRASDAGAGIVSPDTLHEADVQLYELASRSASHLRTLSARLAEDGVELWHDALAECGSLVLALARHEDPWFTELLELARSRNPEVAEISVGEAREMFPPLGSPWRALHNPSAARVDGRALLGALRSAGRRRGVTTLHMEAVGFDRQGDRVTAVNGPHEVVHCGELVLATGAWSQAAGRALGLELPVAPTKGQIVHMVLPEAGGSARRPTDSSRWPIVQPVLNFYLVPWPGGRIACGGTFEAEAGFDTRPTARGVNDLLRECMTIAPGLAEATFSEVRVGLRPTSRDDKPLLGPMPGTENVHVCTGHGANGLMLGPYCAFLVSEAVRGETPAELAPYGLTRFT